MRRPAPQSESRSLRLYARLLEFYPPAFLERHRAEMLQNFTDLEAEAAAQQSVEKEDFGSAMQALAKLRPAVDAFFDKVTVNVDDKSLRENRLKLLNEIRAATRAVADFSRIEG